MEHQEDIAQVDLSEIDLEPSRVTFYWRRDAANGSSAKDPAVNLFISIIYSALI